MATLLEDDVSSPSRPGLVERWWPWALGVLVGLVVAFVADRVARPVRLTLRSGGASVVVHRAHASFVAEAARRWE